MLSLVMLCDSIGTSPVRCNGTYIFVSFAKRKKTIRGKLNIEKKKFSQEKKRNKRFSLENNLQFYILFEIIIIIRDDPCFI